MLFESTKKREVGQNITMVVVSVLTHPDSIEGARHAIEAFRPGLETQMGVKYLLVRRGKPRWLDNGLELLAGIRDLSTGRIEHNLQVAFKRSAMNLDVRIDGDGELKHFEQVARSIVESIRPLTEGDVVPPVKRTRSVACGLNRADKARLSKALTGLPPELAYLRKAILAIAKQDQDLLGSGEADIGPIQRSLRKVAKSGDIKRTAAGHAEMLHRWLIVLPDSDGTWAAPLWFVEGCLRGCALWS
jgi:hypothetical protein